MDDASIILLLKNEPEQGMYEAICKYEGVLSAIAARLLPNTQDVEECVSDAFVEIWKRIDQLDSEQGSLKGYLICTVRSKAINCYKQATRRKTVYLSDELLNFITQDEMETKILLHEDANMLLELIQALAEPEREIMLRKFFLFQPLKEISEAMRLEPNQVKYRLQRTKAQLRDILTEKGVAL